MAVDKARRLHEEHGAEALKVGMGREASASSCATWTLTRWPAISRAQMLGETSVQKRRRSSSA